MTFNSGFRAKRASDTQGIIGPQSQFLQKTYPRPYITGYTLSGIDDQALDPAGGQTIIVNGGNFSTGVSAVVDGTQIGSVTLIDSNHISFTTPAKASGSYTLVVYNPVSDAAAILVPGLIYSGIPTWTTPAGSIGSVYETTTIDTSVVATSDSALTYAITSGSIPTGATFYANGVMTGTAPVDSGSTTYTFAVTATDAELQDTTRTFTLTINTDVVTWNNPSSGAIIPLTAAAYSTTLSATSAAGYSVSYTANALPTGLTLSGNTISGTATVEGTTTTLLTATAATTNRSATNTITWVVSLGDLYWTYVATLLSAKPITMPFNEDASTNNFAVTVNGDTRPYNFNPYTPGYYSNYFDGSGDRITAPASSNFSFSGDFTMEGWMNFNNISSGSPQVLFSIKSGATEFDLRWFTTRWQMSLNAGSGTDFGTTAPVNNVWVHVAAVRSGSSIKLYINGVSTGVTITSSSILGQTNQVFCIGGSASASNQFAGYISNVRIINGTALYLSNFTPPTSPLTAITNTVLLTCQNNRFIDNSTNNFTITGVGDAKVTSATPYTPNSSYSSYGSTYFDGNGDYLVVASNAAFGFGTGDFTIEFWIYPTNAGAALQQVYDNRTATTDTKVNIGVRTNTITYCVGSSILLTSASSSIVSNVWQHVAVVKSSGTTKIYINGTQSGSSYADSYNFTSPAECVIATPGDSRGSATYSFAGNISDVRVTKGQAIYTANFTPPAASLTATANTSLLICQTDQPINNNIFVDNSTNNLAITRAGNTTQGALSPYGTNWSNYFDGSGDVLTIASNANLAFGTGNFTVELWYYATVAPTSSNLCLYNTGTSQFFIQIRNTAFGIGVVGSTENNAFSYNFVQGVWYHIAVCRSGTTVTGFVNGTSVGTGSNSINYGQAGATIGGLTSSSQLVTGYISNLRIVNGIAVYSSNFTPSTSPLQPITNTVLLTCQSPNLVDNSPRNFTITKTGDVSVQKFSPFAGTTLPTPYYSGYFNGTTDYVSLSSPTGMNVGSAACCFEMWVWPNTVANASGQQLFQAGAGNLAFLILNGGALQPGKYQTTGFAQTSATISANTWTHIAVTSDSSRNWRVFINGVMQSYQNYSFTFDQSAMQIGGGNAANGYYSGYISNFRATIGSIPAAYVTSSTTVGTTVFTVPTSPLTAITDTQLLTLQSNTFVDNSVNNNTITAATTTVKPTTTNPFTLTYSTKQTYTPSVYSGSMYFDGTGDYLTIPTSSFLVPSNTYTIEFWMNPAAYPGGTSATSLYQVTNANVSNFGGLLIEFYATGTIRLSVRPATGGTNVTVTATGTIPLNAWTHIAVNVNAGAAKIYVNGISAGTGTVVVLDGTQTFCSSGYLTNGYTTSQVYYTGYLSDLRVVKGQALYTSNFVPQNQPLVAVKNTSLLLNGTSAGMYDSSEMIDLETVGDLKLSTSIVKFAGSTSMNFDGNGDYLVIPYTPLLSQTTPYTLEFWFYPTNNYNGQYIYAQNGGGAFALNWSGTVMRVDKNGVGIQITGTNTLALNQWHHYAMTYDGTTTRVFANGVLDGSTAGTGGSAVVRTTIGYYDSSTSSSFYGYISDFRITKGYARYTTNFTPPTSAFSTN